MDTLNFNDKRYVVVRIINVAMFEDDAEALLFKNHCHAETILKRDGKYFFCDEIPDATEIKEVRPPEPLKPIET